MINYSTNITNLLMAFNKHKIDYLVPWGYNQLPDQLSGVDLDLVINEDLPSELFDELKYTVVNLKQHRVYSKCPGIHYGAHLDYSVDIWTHFCFKAGNTRAILDGETFTDIFKHKITYDTGKFSVYVPTIPWQIIINYIRAYTEKGFSKKYIDRLHGAIGNEHICDSVYFLMNIVLQRNPALRIISAKQMRQCLFNGHYKF